MPDLLKIGPATDDMLDRLQAQFTVHDTPHTDVTHIFINGHGSVGTDLLDTLPNLKMIGSYGVGYDHIDARACAERGVIVTHTPDVLNAEVATTALMLMMACYRELRRDDAYLRAGDWETKGNAPLTRSCDNQTVGIVGMGRIGQEIARKMAPFDPTILYHTRTPKNLPFEHCADLVDMAKRADILFVITPGGPATHHLIKQPVLEALGPNGTIVNVARGTVIDEQAMITALQTGKLGWAGLDVFEHEPAVPSALIDLPNVVLLPHVGSGTVETRNAMGKLTVDNILSHANDGTVLTPVPECSGLV